MRLSGRSRRSLAALFAATTGAAVLTTGAGIAHAQNGDFYTPPTPLPAGSNGDVIKAEPSEFRPEPTGLVGFEGDSYRIMYRSTDTHGDPTAVTGTVLVPDAEWQGAGERPLIGYAPGTQGVGDDCAPSKILELGMEYEGPFVNGLLDKGYAVVVTDYEGLGTPGTHTYVNSASEGHAVLDAVRAAQRLPEAGLPDHGPVALAGYSQGGGATASAAELHPTYAPELDIKGAYSGAPPADLAEVAGVLDGHYAAGFLGYAVLSLDAAYDDIDVRSELNDKGRELFDAVAEQCIAEALLAHAFTETETLTKDGRPLTAYLDEEPYASRVAEQRLGERAPEVPTMVFHSMLDDIVPYEQGKQMAVDWCERGATVQMTSSLAPTHVGGMLGGYPEAVSWIGDRFAGKQAPDNCGTLS